jgi:hypothetical protein
MAKREYTIETARACIERNGGKCGVKSIEHSSPGLRVLGAIDYLVKQGYTYQKNNPQEVMYATAR